MVWCLGARLLLSCWSWYGKGRSNDCCGIYFYGRCISQVAKIFEKRKIASAASSLRKLLNNLLSLPRVILILHKSQDRYLVFGLAQIQNHISVRSTLVIVKHLTYPFFVTSTSKVRNSTQPFPIKHDYSSSRIKVKACVWSFDSWRIGSIVNWEGCLSSSNIWTNFLWRVNVKS